MTAPQVRRFRRLLGRPPGRRSRMRRRVGTAVRLTASLLVVGVLYTLLAPGLSANATDDADLATQISEGKALFDIACITCHGDNARGVPGRGPSLVGVGSAAVEFQVGTGRMPLARQGAEAVRKIPHYTREEAFLIGQYIQSLGGGPQLPNAQQNPDLGAGGDVSRGGDLFRINCSSCHAYAAGGGALTSGKAAPSMMPATSREIYAAMLTGPGNMPVFGDNEITPDEKRDIISYIQYLQANANPGGWGLGRLGPVTEGLAIFLIGMVALVFTTLWIAGKS